jgi:hypothetical protein
VYNDKCSLRKAGGVEMDAAAQLKELMIEVEHLKDENEILFDTVVQMKSSLDRLITVYIGSGKQKMRQAGM